MPGVNSRHWDSIIDALAGGPIVDPSGLATQKLLAVTGHESVNALAKILRRMEEAGVIERDIAGRRTTRIGLTAASLAELPPARDTLSPEAAVTSSTLSPNGDTAALSPNGDDGIDYDLLASALLAKALKATQAQEASAGAKDAEARARTAEARASIAEADAQAARAKTAELESMVRALEHNMKALQAALDKPAARQGDSIRARLTASERRDLDQLMRALPTRRG